MKIPTSWTKEQIFSTKLVHKVIDFFPYPERNCPFCEQKLKIFTAIHIQDSMHDYKVVYMCDNKNCGSFDEEAGKRYARVYYSSPEAFKQLELIFIPDPRKSIR